MDYQEHLDKAKANRKQLKKVSDRIIRKKPNDLDKVVHQAHDKAFEKIDCLNCANCCKTTSPLFRDKDIDRLAKFLRMKSVNFIEKYLQIDEDNDYVFKSAPCPFLQNDNYCSVYEARPNACREYPHTDRKKIVQIMDLTRKNAMICPAVTLVFDELIEKY